MLSDEYGSILSSSTRFEQGTCLMLLSSSVLSRADALSEDLFQRIALPNTNDTLCTVSNSRVGRESLRGRGSSTLQIASYGKSGYPRLFLLRSCSLKCSTPSMAFAREYTQLTTAETHIATANTIQAANADTLLRLKVRGAHGKVFCFCRPFLNAPLVE